MSNTRQTTQLKYGDRVIETFGAPHPRVMTVDSVAPRDGFRGQSDVSFRGTWMLRSAQNDQDWELAPVDEDRDRVDAEARVRKYADDFKRSHRPDHRGIGDDLQVVLDQLDRVRAEVEALTHGQMYVESAAVLAILGGQ